MSAVLVLGLALVSLGAPVVAEKRPNVVFIMTDDQDFRSVGRMPNVQNLLARKGVTFTRAYASTPTCCPSRVSFLTGKYVHNHGVLTNTGPEGGYPKAKELGIEQSTVATWLDSAGYDTAYAGKYLNQYLGPEIPPGWDRWWAYTRGIANPDWYEVNENGTSRRVDRQKVSDPEYLARVGENFLRNRKTGRPFFLVLAPFVPHKPYFHAERHAKLFSVLNAPRYPNFNEEDVSDKPWHVQQRKLYTEEDVARLDEGYRDRMRGLMGVDEMVGKVVGALEEKGLLESTYIVYTSDNGYLMGEHRWEGKSAPYENSIKLPFIVRGPGIAEGSKKGHMIANVDWAPTMADWAGVSAENVDGRSFAPILSGERVVWRKRLLLEYYGEWFSYQGIRTADNKLYAEHAQSDYAEGSAEFYNLLEDPHQLENAYSSMDPALQESLSTKLAALKGCDGQACREVESTP